MKQKLSVADLRKRLEEVFREWTERSAEYMLQKAPPIWTKERLDDLAEMLDAIHALLRGNLTSDTNFCTPGDEFFTLAERLMRVQLYQTYPSRHVAENLTDDQIAAAADAIEAGDFNALEPLSHPSRRTDYTMPMDEQYWRYDMMLGNLSYLCYVYANMAKRFGARQTGLEFLLLANRFSAVKKNYFKRFKPDEIPELVDRLRSAMSDLSLALDYFRLPDWAAFRAAEEKKLVAEEARSNERNKA